MNDDDDKNGYYSHVYILYECPVFLFFFLSPASLSSSCLFSYMIYLYVEHGEKGKRKKKHTHTHTQTFIFQIDFMKKYDHTKCL